ncbi:MAG: PaaI family thioesterase [Candidatus Competibacteraceae bacterium]
MTEFKTPNPDFEQAIRNSFARQGIMRHLNAMLGAIRPGFVEIELPYSDDVSQQHGFFHGGVVGTIADSA